MAEYLEAITKYCNKCKHKSYCYRPCPLILAALNDLPCEQQLLQKCKETEDENG